MSPQRPFRGQARRAGWLPLSFLLGLLLPAGRAAAAAPHWYDQFQLSGYADVYFAYNTNRPTTDDNFVPGIGTTAKKHNQFSLNLAALEIDARTPIIVHLTLNFGPATEVVHVGEPKGDF